MPPTDRVVPSFAAEPPQELLPYGRWAETLAEHFLAACDRIESEGEDLGRAREIVWFPDRTYAGRTYVPATALTDRGYELYGFVSFLPGGESSDASDFESHAEYTDETAERNPDWQLDLSDAVIGSWRGEQGKVAAVTLVWGVPITQGGGIVTAELADLAVDQCVLVEGRFTLIAPDAYRGDYIEVKLFDKKGGELARESLYEDDGEEE